MIREPHYMTMMRMNILLGLYSNQRASVMVMGVKHSIIGGPVRGKARQVYICKFAWVSRQSPLPLSLTPTSPLALLISPPISLLLQAELPPAE